MLIRFSGEGLTMSDTVPMTRGRVAELVLANRAIRAPYYESEHDAEVEFTDLDRGLQWGVDVIPGLLGLFLIEEDPRDTHSEGWIGFARHWRGGTLRFDIDLFSVPGDALPILVVTAVSGRVSEGAIEDEELGTIELPGDIPSQAEWTDREKQYQAVRRKDDTDGAAAVQAFIAALPDWKRELAEQFDQLIETEVPGVRRAIKWHQPFYGAEGTGWFASFNAFTKHVKLSFICDQYLKPKPPTGTDPTRQALDLTKTDTFNEDQIASWVRQAAAHPGINW